MGDEDGEGSVVDVVADLVVVVAVVVEDEVVVVVVVVVSFPEWMNEDTASGCLASANTIVTFPWLPLLLPVDSDRIDTT